MQELPRRPYPALPAAESTTSFHTAFSEPADTTSLDTIDPAHRHGPSPSASTASFHTARLASASTASVDTIASASVHVPSASASTASFLTAVDDGTRTPVAGGSRRPSLPTRSLRSSFEHAVRTMLPASAAASSAAIEEHEMTEFGPVAQHRHPDNRVRTSDGGGFALTNGRILSWSKGKGTWNLLAPENVVAIRLGADGRGYACTAENELLRLDGAEVERIGGLTAGPIFNVSPSGRITSVAPAEDGPATIRLTRPPEGGGAPVHTTLPLPPGNPDVRALAYSNNGDLHLLTSDGRLWQTHPAQQPDTDTPPWREVPGPAGLTATSLFTLEKSKEVGVCGPDGTQRHQLEKNGTWTPLPDNAPTGLQRTYGQLRYSQQKFTNATLGSPFTPGSARSDKIGLSWWQSKLAVLGTEITQQLVPRDGAALADNVTADRMGRYLNYFMAHYLPGPSLPAPTQQSPDKQLREEFTALLALPPTTPPRTPVDPRVAEAMHTNAEMVLDRLERALGITDADGNENPNWTNSKAVRAARHERANTDDNMLYALLQRRNSFMPADGSRGADPGAARTTQRLQRLVDAGVHLQRPLPAHAPRTAHGYRAVPALMRDSASDALRSIGKPETQGLDILVGKLVHDQLHFEKAVQRDATTEAHVAADLARLTGEDGNLITRRFKQEIWDSRAEAVFDSMRSILAGFGQSHHVLNRAARFQGMLGEDHEKDYVRQVEELEPGNSIELKYTVQAGVDGDGWSHNYTPADRFKEGAHPDVKTPAELKGRFNIPMNIVPNILPVPAASVAHIRSMTITKRTDGIDISFSKAYESEVKLLCAKIKWGAGEYGANKRMTADGKESRSVLGLGFLGLEVVPAALVFGKGSDQSIKLSLNNDENGTVGSVVERLLSGQITPEQLLDAAAAVSYTRKQSTKWTNTLDIQGLFAAVGIFTPKLKLDERLKIVAAIVEQWTANLTFSKDESRTQDASGITTSRTLWSALAGLNRKIINVTEIQGSWLKALPAFSTLIGKTKGIIIGDGYEMEHKVPTWIDLQVMELIPQGGLYDAPTAHEAADGTFTKLSYNVSTSKEFNFEALAHWDDLVRHSPETADNLRSAAEKARAQGLTVSVEMELVPAALAALNGVRPDPDGHIDPAMAQDLSALVEHRDSWRPARLVVSAGEQYNTALVVGASAGRYKSHASNTHQVNLALIDITYDDSDGAEARPLGSTVRGPLTNGGGEPQFDQLDTLAHPDTMQVVYGILDEPRNGPRRRLAALPPNGADAAGLRELRDQLLREPIPAPHLALADGELTLQSQVVGNHWQRVALDETERRQLLSQPGIDTAGLLQLMHAGASGRLEIDPGDLAALGGGERAQNRRGAPPLSEGVPSERPLAITALMDDAARFNSMVARGVLSPAQQLVVSTFFQGDGGTDRALVVAQDPDMMTALGHAIGRSVNEAQAETAPHDTPEVEAPADTQHHSVMVSSGAIASASGGGA